MLFDIPVRFPHRLLLRRHPGGDEGGATRSPEPGGNRPNRPKGSGPSQSVSRNASQEV